MPWNGYSYSCEVLRRVLTAATIFLFLGLLAAPAAAAASVISRPLGVSDLPAGFKVIGVPLVAEPCSGMFLPNDAEHRAVIGFRSATMAIEEALTMETRAPDIYRELNLRYSGCRSIPLTRSSQGSKLSGIGTKLRLPRIGDQSQAFSFHLDVNGYHLNDDVVIFRKNLACGVVTFISQEALSQQSVELVSDLAASKAYTYST
jgi:hypothetical protein